MSYETYAYEQIIEELNTELASLRTELEMIKAHSPYIDCECGKRLHFPVEAIVLRAGSLPDDAVERLAAAIHRCDVIGLAWPDVHGSVRARYLAYAKAALEAFIPWLSPVVPAAGPITAEALYRAAAVPAAAESEFRETIERQEREMQAVLDLPQPSIGTDRPKTAQELYEQELWINGHLDGMPAPAAPGVGPTGETT